MDVLHVQTVASEKMEKRFYVLIVVVQKQSALCFVKSACVGRKLQNFGIRSTQVMRSVAGPCKSVRSQKENKIMHHFRCFKRINHTTAG